MKKKLKKNFFNDVAITLPRHVAIVVEFQGLGTPGNSQPSRRAEKHLIARGEDQERAKKTYTREDPQGSR